jgi:uncharacterized protein YdcH (DUF465 family)
MDSKIQKLEDRKQELENLIAQKTEEMKSLSRAVSEIQVQILELKGELKATNKIINLLKKS